MKRIWCYENGDEDFRISIDLEQISDIICEATCVTVGFKDSTFYTEHSFASTYRALEFHVELTSAWEAYLASK